MKTWTKIGLGVIALGLLGKLADVQPQPQPQSQPQPQQEKTMETINEDFVKNNFKEYDNYTYMRDDIYAKAKNLADAKQYGGKVQIPHMRLVAVQGDYVSMESDDGCKLLLKMHGEFKEYVLTYISNHDENLVFVTLERVGGRTDDGKFIYVGTIEYATETVIGGVK